jgi:hypothetical protein
LGLKGSILFLELGDFLFFGDEKEAAELRCTGGAQRPLWRVNEPKKTGARSARARTRGQNPLVCNTVLVYYQQLITHKSMIHEVDK